MEGFAEAVRVVAVVGVEGVGEGVAFGLEHQALAVVLVERLIDGGGAGVGWDEKKAQGRFFGFLHRFLVLGAVVFVETVLVFEALGFIEVAELVVDVVDEVLAEGDAPLAGRGAGGDEGEEVGIDNALVVDAADFGEAGGEGGEGSKEEDVGVALVVGDFNDAAGTGAGVRAWSLPESRPWG